MALINFFSKDMRWIIDVKTSLLNDGAGLAQTDRDLTRDWKVWSSVIIEIALTHSLHITKVLSAVSIKMVLQLCVCSPDGHLIKLNRDQLLPS